MLNFCLMKLTFCHCFFMGGKMCESDDLLCLYLSTDRKRMIGIT